MYQFQYTLSERDYYEFNKYHALHSPANRKGLWAIRLIFPILFLVMAFLPLIYAQPLNMQAWIGRLVIYLILAVGWFFCAKPLYLLLLKLNIKLIKKDGKLYDADSFLQFQEDTIMETTDRGQNRWFYSSLERIGQGEKMIYLYIGAAQAILIPKSVFQTNDQMQEFLQFVQEKMTKAKLESDVIN